MQKFFGALDRAVFFYCLCFPPTPPRFLSQISLGIWLQYIHFSHIAVSSMFDSSCCCFHFFFFLFHFSFWQEKFCCFRPISGYICFRPLFKKVYLLFHNYNVVYVCVECIIWLNCAGIAWSALFPPNSLLLFFFFFSFVPFSTYTLSFPSSF